ACVRITDCVIDELGDAAVRVDASVDAATNKDVAGRKDNGVTEQAELAGGGTFALGSVRPFRNWLPWRASGKGDSSRGPAPTYKNTGTIVVPWQQGEQNRRVAIAVGVQIGAMLGGRDRATYRQAAHGVINSACQSGRTPAWDGRGGGTDEEDVPVGQ